MVLLLFVFVVGWAGSAPDGEDAPGNFGLVGVLGVEILVSEDVGHGFAPFVFVVGWVVSADDGEDAPGNFGLIGLSRVEFLEVQQVDHFCLPPSLMFLVGLS